MERVLAGRDEVLFLLAHHCFHIGKLAGGKYGDKDFHLGDLSAVFVNYGELLSRKINEKLVACLVVEMHHGIHSGLPLVIVEAELGILESIWKLFDIGFPEHHAGNSSTLQLPVNSWEAALESQ